MCPRQLLHQYVNDVFMSLAVVLLTEPCIADYTVWYHGSIISYFTNSVTILEACFLCRFYSRSGSGADSAPSRIFPLSVGKNFLF